MQYPILKEAKDALEKLSADPEARERAERREIELKLYEYGAATLRAEGRAEGLLEGRAEGLLEGRAEGLSEGRAHGKVQTLLRLLARKFGELPSEVHARAATGSERDLDRWLERLLTAEALDAVFTHG
jgi:flagellar biosynthesis/type III secretory pathway protein FliH